MAVGFGAGDVDVPELGDAPAYQEGRNDDGDERPDRP
jgi:hypothetical protein